MPVPSGPDIRNWIVNPSFTYDNAGQAPASWTGTSPGGWSHVTTGATLTAHNMPGGPGPLEFSALATPHDMWVTATAASQGAVISLGVMGESYPPSTAPYPNGTFTFSAYVAGQAGGEQVTILAGPDSSAASATATMTIGWARMSCSFNTSDVDTVYASVRLGAAGTVLVAACQVNAGATPNDYVDGDAAGCEWDGMPGNGVTIRYY